MTIAVDNKALVTETSESSRKGFTLTEVAIVLGIVGLILSAIWVAANAVYNNMRVNKANTELLQISQAVKAFYANSQTVDTTAGTDMTVPTNTSTTYVNAGIFPSDTIATGKTGSGTTTSTPVNPWGGAIAVMSAKQTTAGDSFFVDFDAVPLSACIDLLTLAAGQNHDASVFGDTVAASGTGPSGTPAPGNQVLPVLPSAANTACSGSANAAGQVNVAIAFALRSSGIQ